MTIAHAPRGFAIYAGFTDCYGHHVRVQESSLATEAAVGIFCSHNDDEPLGAAPSPHLTIAMAKIVRDALDAFITDAEGDQE